MKMKRLIAMLLCFIMTTSVFVGCGDKETKKEDDGRTTITIGIPQNMSIPDYDTNAFTVWLEETTGYNIEFYFFASNSGDYASQLSTMIAGGKEKLPDMLFNFSLGSEVYRQYGEYGYFLELSSYFNDPEKGKPFWDRVAELPEVMQTRIEEDLCETGTENIYALPFLQNSSLDALNYQVYINKTWLDKLGLDMPTDNESLYQVLKAFVNNDPNGNGKKDEIGIIGSTKSLGSDPVEYLMNLFVNVNDDHWFNLDSNGEIYLPHITDEYREGLKYINTLVKEGLMPDTCWSMSAGELTTLLNPSNGINRVGIWVGHPTLVLNKDTEANYEYVALPNWGYVNRGDDLIGRTAFITTDCENPDAAWDVYMAMTSEEGALRMRYGEKGVDWDDADEGTTSYTGQTAEIKVMNPTAYTDGNSTWHCVKATLLEYPEDEVTQMQGEMDEWNKWKLELVKSTWDNYVAQREAKPVITMPRVKRTEAQSEETEIVRSNCQNWITTNRANFCTGKNSADPYSDTQWNDYVNEFKKLELDVWMNQVKELYNEQY